MVKIMKKYKFNLIIFLICCLSKSVFAQTGWVQQPSGTTQHLTNIVFNPNNLHGFAVGSNGTILRSTNGGFNWASQNSTTANYLYGCYQWVPDLAWVCGDNGTILKTINGGTTWVPQPSGTANALLSIIVPNSTTGWAVGTLGTLLKTVNARHMGSAKPSGRF
jgi:photosystem II stability/assembly factor-like uncharacterized protein